MSLPSYDKEALARLCRRRRIRRLALFGSVLKGTDRPDSDVDFLVEFEPDAVPGLLGLAGIESELSVFGGPAGRFADRTGTQSAFSPGGRAHGRGPVCRLRIGFVFST